MHNYVSWILLTCILIFNCSNAVPLLDFISFGQSSGDSKFSGVHRGASLVISIVPNIPYFNETYSSISVSSILNLLVQIDFGQWCNYVCIRAAIWQFGLITSQPHKDVIMYIF